MRLKNVAGVAILRIKVSDCVCDSREEAQDASCAGAADIA